MRREWIREGKPNRSQDSEPEPDTHPQAQHVKPRSEDNDRGTIAAPVPTQRPVTPLPGENGDGDLYDATPQAVLNERRRKRDAAAVGGLFISDDEGAAGDPPSEDELDALLAEDALMDLGPAATNIQQAKTEAKHQDRDENFDDEMEAMAEMGDMW